MKTLPNLADIFEFIETNPSLTADDADLIKEKLQLRYPELKQQDESNDDGRELPMNPSDQLDLFE
ncbi:MAG: hypothetical protein ACE37E_07765 [Hyphomicrobiales bacterium]